MRAMSETYENDMRLEATKLRLGLPGSKDLVEKKSTTSNEIVSNKRESPVTPVDSGSSTNQSSVSDARNGEDCPPPSKLQIVGWPPIRPYRKNTLEGKKTSVEASGMYVKVSMDGAPYLRKIDLNVYPSYGELLEGLEKSFKVCIGKYSARDAYNGSDYVPTYEDKDGDWMLLGDVPWEMFISSCKRLRVMKSSDAIGIGCL